MHDNVRKGFLQMCINHGTVKIESAKDILKTLCEANDVEAPSNQDEFNNFIKELNSTLKNLNQALNFVQHPLINQEFLVFGLTAENEVGRQQPHYSSVDRHYFAKLLENMVQQEEYGIAWNKMYFDDEAELQKQLSKNRMQLLIKTWTAQGYFLEKGDILYFGPRMMVEYSHYLKTNYSDCVHDCPLCGNLVFWDVQCSECETKIHRDCMRKYLIRMSTCPTCSKTWNTPLNVSQ